VTLQPVHSPLGGSGAERWIECGGSIALIKALDLPPTEDKNYRREGVAAHAAAAHCVENGLDAWEVIGQEFDGLIVDVGMADAIQSYLTHVAPMIAKAKDGQGEMLCELRVGRPDIHPDFYGTPDFSYYDHPILDIVDYKHGEGIAVDADWNTQMMYYAYAELQLYPEAKTINMTIVQPRAIHPAGPIRTFSIRRADLEKWAQEVLIPAMQHPSIEFLSGSWCRFCPAKLVCPVMTGLFRAASIYDPTSVVGLSDDTLGRDYAFLEQVKMVCRAIEAEIYARGLRGITVPGTKLVAQRSNRVLKEGGREVFEARFGGECYYPPEFKSPPDLEKINPTAKALGKEWFDKPQAGLTVAHADDKRPAVTIETAAEVFAAIAAKGA